MHHKDIWRGPGPLAARHGLSASGRAKRAGPCPTSFNPSMRAGDDGGPRWPRAEGLARVPDTVGAGLDEFAALADGRRGGPALLTGFAQAGQGGFIDDAGSPAGAGRGDMIENVLARKTVRITELAPLNPDYPSRRSRPPEIAGILRASQ